MHQVLFNRLPKSRQERWSLLKQFSQNWHPHPFTFKNEGFDTQLIRNTENRLGIKLPSALKEWYQLCGARADFWSSQDTLRVPSDLIVDSENMMIIFDENQGMVSWAIKINDLDAEDPPVYLLEDGIQLDPESLKQESHSVSEFALAYAFYVTIINSQQGDEGAIISNNIEIEKELTKMSLTRANFSDWHWGGFPTRFYESLDLLVYINGEDSNYNIQVGNKPLFSWLRVAAKNKKAYEKFASLLGEQVDLDVIK